MSFLLMTDSSALLFSQIVVPLNLINHLAWCIVIWHG